MADHPRQDVWEPDALVSCGARLCASWHYVALSSVMVGTEATRTYHREFVSSGYAYGPHFAHAAPDYTSLREHPKGRKSLATVTMPLREEPTFTFAEYYTALQFALPIRDAKRLAREICAFQEVVGWDSVTAEELAASPYCGPRSIDGDLYDLLTLVSEDCARRAWRLMSLSDEQGAGRQATFLRERAAQLRTPPLFTASAAG